MVKKKGDNVSMWFGLRWSMWAVVSGIFGGMLLISAGMNWYQLINGTGRATMLGAIGGTFIGLCFLFMCGYFVVKMRQGKE